VFDVFKTDENGAKRLESGTLGTIGTFERFGTESV
jgi:hypothetical protein